MTDRCTRCGGPLGEFDRPLTQKLLGLGTTECLCKRCLAEYFGVTEADLDNRITRFRRMGCVLFPPLDDEQPEE